MSENRLSRRCDMCDMCDLILVNFASRKICFKCETDKPPQPDEWECDSCGFQNKDFRRECMECGNKNPNPVKDNLREVLYLSHC